MRLRIACACVVMLVAVGIVVLPAQETCISRWMSIKNQLVDVQAKTSTLRSQSGNVSNTRYNALVASEAALKSFQDAFEAAACIVVSPPPPPPPQPACSDG